MAYNPNFQWKQKTITITAVSALPAGYQVKLIIPLQTGMQSDFRDLRFETIDGYGLPHWLESINTVPTPDEATVWVKLKNAVNASTSVDVYMYYSNPYVASTSNGDSTFVFFDNFDNLNKWNYGNGVTIANNIMTRDGTSAMTSKSEVGILSDFILDVRMKASYVMIITAVTNATAADNVGYTGPWWYAGYNEAYCRVDGVGLNLGWGSAGSSAWYNYRLIVPSSGNVVFEVWNDGMTSLLHTTSTATKSTSTKSYIGWHLSSGYNGSYSKLKIRKYVAAEPTTVTIDPTVYTVPWNPQRKAITINTTSATPANYQVKLTIPFSPEMNIDFSDLRFVSKTNVPLDYWIESSTPGIIADVWVELADSINASSSDYIYMHYGNPNLTSISNGTNTFIQWHGMAMATYKDANTIPYSNIVYESSLFVTSSAAVNFVGIRSASTYNTGDSLTVQFVGSSNVYGMTGNNGTFTESSGTYSYVSTNLKMKIVDTGSAAHFYINGNEIGTGNTQNLPNENMGLMMETNAIETQYWSFARKYIATEPSFSIGSAEPMNSFSYRKTLTINNNSGVSLTDYQVPIIVTYSNHMQSNFNDIRFVDVNGNLLPYWIESKTDNSTATVWIRVNLPNIGTSPTGDNTVYMYYGNTNVSSASTGTSTFEFFDDFENGNASRWSLNTGSAFAIKTDNKKGMYSYGYGAGSGRMETPLLLSAPYIVESDVYFSSSTDSLIFVTQTDSNYVMGIVNQTTYYQYWTNTSPWWNTGIATPTFDSWVTLRMIYKSTTLADYYEGNRLIKANAAISGIPTKIVIGATHTNSRFDNVRVRKYIATEPTYTTGAEEIPANITATSLTITPSDPCISGSCTVTVDVIWTNTGGTSESFTPSIKIDTVPVVTDPVLTPVTVAPSLTASQQFIISGLTTGTHNICPDPN